MRRSSIRLRRTLAARRDRVFEAWCRGDLLAQWFLPAPGWRAAVRADARVGGRFRIEVTDPEGGLHVQEGEFLTIEPPSRLIFSWTCRELEVADSTVTVELGDLGERTELVLTHELPDDPAVLESHERGWVGCLTHLDAFLSGDPPHQG